MGTLNGYTVIELAGIGPGPMAGMMLADMDARVIVIERFQEGQTRRNPIGMRGKESMVINLKNPQGVSILLELIDRADVLIDPYRPGVCERLGIGPDICLERNPGLVYGRITGWGQDGPLANAPGHDLGYLSITGALHAIGEHGGKPQIPLNMIADMGGGGMLLLNGILAALLERHQSGLGQVVDAAMVDGAIHQLLTIHEMAAQGNWNTEQRGVNLLDGGAHHYNVYECSDGKYISICALEDKFHQFLLYRLGLDQDTLPDHKDSINWPFLRDKIASIINTRPRHEWCEMLEGSDACVSPILDLGEAPDHPANKERSSYAVIDGVLQAAPAPRFSRTESKIDHAAPKHGEHTHPILHEIGTEARKIQELLDAGIVLGPETIDNHGQ
ncbi:MAG: CaiB/BaiF CoA-transferase family protein [Gammaproteobacteria bacterium]|nr:CaiB/BaiF CoA-transferase family protein [Gammaproteobacteria bacterium]